MVRKQKSHRSRSVKFTFKQRHIELLLDKVLIFRFIRNLHGRFWGLAGISVMIIGFSVCFLIRPDLVRLSTAISDFGGDTRTAPYFAGSVFFAAYGLWRWRNYLSRSWRRPGIVTGLVTLTVVGLYLVALMPITWRPIPYHIHLFGVSLAGASMLVTVVLDGLLSKTGKDGHPNLWRLIRFLSFSLIVVGGVLTFGSIDSIGWYDVSLLGETLLIAGYFIWITLRTFLGEGNRTVLARILRKLVLID